MKKITFYGKKTAPGETSHGHARIEVKLCEFTQTGDSGETVSKLILRDMSLERAVEVIKSALINSRHLEEDFEIE